MYFSSAAEGLQEDLRGERNKLPSPPGKTFLVQKKTTFNMVSMVVVYLWGLLMGMSAAMDVTLDRVLNSDIRRQPSASNVPAREATPAAAVTVQSAVAVKAVTQTEKTPPAVTEPEREEDLTRRQELATKTPPAAGRYARQLVYERELDRTFVDVVARDDKERLLMRIPAEKLVRFLASQLRTEASQPTMAPQVDMVA